MTAELRRLDGTPLKTAKPQKRNQRVAQLLDELAERNDAGEVHAVAFVYLTESGSWVQGWTWPKHDTDGFPWDLAMRGALTALLHEIGASAVEAPPPVSGEAG